MTWLTASIYMCLYLATVCNIAGFAIRNLILSFNEHKRYHITLEMSKSTACFLESSKSKLLNFKQTHLLDLKELNGNSQSC